MNTSDITSPYQQPLSPIAQTRYRPKSDDFLAADVSANSSTYSDSARLALDTSRYEFPGDVTYQKYLSSRRLG